MDLLIVAQVPVPTPDNSIFQLISGLGSSGAVIVAIWMFIAFIRHSMEAQQQRDDRLFAQFGDLAKDRGQIIRDNTQALGKIEASVDRLTDLIDQRDIADRKPGQ